MMQDAVLTLCKDSVKNFVTEIVKYMPDETSIFTTSKVENKFIKKFMKESHKALSVHSEEALKESDEEANASEEDEKEEDPNPLFLLDLVLKPGDALPKYSTDPDEIVKIVCTIFDEGIKALQAIPQLEPILLKKLFKTHSKQMLKAPIRPLTEPRIPERKNILPDENTWLWEAYKQVENAMKKAVAPLKEFLNTFKQFQEQNVLNPDMYMKTLNNIDKPASVDEIKADINKN